jgi:hypothetical protein
MMRASLLVIAAVLIVVGGFGDVAVAAVAPAGLDPAPLLEPAEDDAEDEGIGGQCGPTQHWCGNPTIGTCCDARAHCCHHKGGNYYCSHSTC